MAGVAVVFALFAALLPLLLSAQNHTTFIFNRFNASTDLTFLGNTSIRSKYDALCLTDQSQRVYGRALYAHPVRFKNPGSTNTNFSFSTSFVFTMVPSPVDILTGYGMAFIIAPDKSPVANSSGYLGLFNTSTIGKSENHLFAVEFDTVDNPDLGDPDNNHVGIDINGITSVQSESAAYWNGTEFQKLDLNSGHNIQAWIDYDHLENQINITIVPAGSVRPLKPLLSRRNMNLSDIFHEEMYVGFSAGTGIFVEDHCILAWSFTNNGVAPALNASHLPSLLHKRSKSSKALVVSGVTVACVLVLLLVGLIVSVWWWKRRMYRDLVEEWEVEYWPHRFKYEDLHVATKGFRDEQVLGCGGFGRVYKGVLPSNGLQVAVKRILRESSEGVKDFIAEISSLGRLRHRNLVQIRGYCKRGMQLFIVYDFMPNGSLDKLIFGNPDTVLKWAQRYKVLRDVAAGLLYLHQGWEKRVVHRDIKSNNILLDDKFDGKLGDFGLARLYEHDQKPLTTRLVGTLGYIAPELGRRGKATPSSDVYSFGIVMLEVACGRRPVELDVDGTQILLVDWVRDLHANGRVMDAADPNLGGEYAEEEMDRVLRLGMVCCSERAEARVDMREVVQILEGGASAEGLVAFEGRTEQERRLDDDIWKMRSSGDCPSSWSLEAR